MWAFSSVRIVRFVLAPMLSLWVAGVGCMLGCEGMVAVATDKSAATTQHSEHIPTIVASGHACASNKTHDCCNKRRPESKTKARSGTPDRPLITSERPSSGMMNCPLAVSRAAVVTKAQGGDTSASPALARSTLPAQSSLEQIAPLSTPLRLPNRGHTYLRCCVFLI